MKKRLAVLILLGSCLAAPAALLAADHLRLNPRLDYSSDSQDGLLITGDYFEEGAARGEPNYVIVYAEGSFNSKRQERRTGSACMKSHVVILRQVRLEHKSSGKQSLWSLTPELGPSEAGISSEVLRFS